MDINIAKGINFDYILVLKLNDSQRLELTKEPIRRSISLIQQLFSYSENSCYDIVDMYKVLCQNTKTNEEFPYCLSHNYSDSFINPEKFPEINEFEYRQEAQSYNKKLFHKYYRRLKFNHRDWSEYDLQKETEKNIRDEFEDYILKTKRSYLKKCLNYVYSYDYHYALNKIKTSANVVSFSNESHGRFSYEHKVNDDLKVRISTNFCYGSASSFRVIITYKDIELLPYSIWVKYYYAGFCELLHCTRSYLVVRSSWDACMSFVENFVNSAIDNPERFVREVILQEVYGMMDGLRTIYSQGKEYLNSIMSVNAKEETGYVGIRHIRNATEDDRRYYSVYPDEMYLVYRTGKISGALRFLNSLKQLSSLCIEINDCIAEIISMNISIYPELLEALPPIETDIKRLEKLLKKEEKSLETLERRYEILDNKLARILSKYPIDELSKRRELFIKNNPSYGVLSTAIVKQNEIVNHIQRNLYSRKSFFTYLCKFKSLIENNVTLPKAI